MGRPTNYRPEFCKRVGALCGVGATDQEVADSLGISIRRFYEYQSLHPDFRHAVKLGKAPADERVEKSLFARATGYERDDIDIRVVDGAIVQTVVRKWHPPDTVACIFWLKNRRPDLWREKTEVELSARSVNDLSDDDLAAIAAGRAIERASYGKSKPKADV